jgi:hypothetical protein
MNQPQQPVRQILRNHPGEAREFRPRRSEEYEQEDGEMPDLEDEPEPMRYQHQQQRPQHAARVFHRNQATINMPGTTISITAPMITSITFNDGRQHRETRMFGPNGG